MRREDTVRTSLVLFTCLAFIWVTMTSAIQGRVLGVVFLALVIWSLYPERHFESSVLVIILLATFQASLDWSVFIDSLFSTYGGSILWIIISGFVLAKGMESSGLAHRIALWIATSLGGDPNRVVLSVAIANLAVAPPFRRRLRLRHSSCSPSARCCSRLSVWRMVVASLVPP